MIETNLVDFKSLEQDPTGTRRNELLKGVAALFAVACDRCTLEQIEIYDDVLVRLSELASTEARSSASAKLAPLRRAPERIVRFLANDESIGVAGPMLAKSPVLTEADLVNLARTRGSGHLTAIAQRSYLSEQLSDVVVSRGDMGVRRVVAAHHGAMLGDAALAELSRQAMTDVVLATSLGQRPDTPDNVIDALMTEAADEVRSVLSERSLRATEQRVDTGTRHTGERMSNEYWLGLYDFESAWERAHCRGWRAATEQALCQYAAEDRFADVVAVFALLGDLDIEETKHWLVRTDTEPFLIIAKSMELRFSTVQALLSTGPWRHRLSEDQRSKALYRFKEIESRAARGRMTAWRETRMAS
jgi:uncharacterized protein (DUF2336 family)